MGENFKKIKGKALILRLLKAFFLGLAVGLAFVGTSTLLRNFEIWTLSLKHSVFIAIGAVVVIFTGVYFILHTSDRSLARRIDNEYKLDEKVQTMLAYLQSFESDFVKSLVDKSAKDKKREIASRRKKLETNKMRISELDGIFKRIYEDNISGKLSDERFAKLSADYEREQKQLISDTEELENELNQEAEQVDNVEYFLNIVRQYTEIKELSARVVNDLIDKIKIHAVDKSSGQRIQRIDIYYTAVGLIDVSQHIQELAI